MKMKRFRIYGEIWGSMVGMSFVAGLVMSIVSGVGFQDSGNYFFQTFGIYSMIAGALVLLITPFSMYQSYVPMMISMNCRRREVFAGFQILKVLSPLSVAAVSGIFLIINHRLQPENNPMGEQLVMMAAGFCFLMMFASFGNLMGVLYTRFGKTVMIIFTLCSGIGGGVIGWTCASGIKQGSDSVIRMIYDGNTPLLLICMAAAALGMVLADVIVSWVSIRKLEVRC